MNPQPTDTNQTATTGSQLMAYEYVQGYGVLSLPIGTAQSIIIVVLKLVVILCLMAMEFYNEIHDESPRHRKDH